MIRHNSFISSFKKKVQALFLILVFITFFLAGNKLLNYLYWEEDEWCRILWHNYYEQTENIDYLYLGSSHVYFDLNPEILDKSNEKNNFNMATPAQRLIESFYLLKEIDRHNEIEKVYLEMYYDPSTGALGNYHEKISVQNGWRCMDYMRCSYHKAEILMSINPMQYYMEAFFPFIRYRQHLTDDSWVKEQVQHKESEDYKKYIYDDGVKVYKDKGYSYDLRELTNSLLIRGRGPEEMNLTEDAEKYLRRIIEYCQENNISITLFVSPIYELQLLSTENYDRYAKQIKDIAMEYEVSFYDFNMAKEDYLPIQNKEYFVDVGHLNAKGAELYTNFFNQVVSADLMDNKDYFYQTYQEKLENSEAKVYGLYCYDAGEDELQEADEPGKTRRMVIASNREKELEYQVFVTPDNCETYLLQDFSTNKVFNISKEEHGICKIIWRSIDNKAKMESMEIQY